MTKLEAIITFNLKDFDKLTNITRKGADVNGVVYVGDTFECDEEMKTYLLGANPLNKAVAKVIEEEVKEELPVEQTKEIAEEAVQEVIEEQDREYVKPKKKKRK